MVPTEKDVQNDSTGHVLITKDLKIDETRLFRIALKTLNEKTFLDLRVWGLADKGRWYPKKHGLFFDAVYFKHDLIPVLNEILATL